MVIDLRERDYRTWLSTRSNCVGTVPFHSFESPNSVPISAAIVRLTTQSSPRCRCTIVEVDKQVQFQSERTDREDVVEGTNYSTHRRTIPRIDPSDLQRRYPFTVSSDVRVFASTMAFSQRRRKVWLDAPVFRCVEQHWTGHRQRNLSIVAHRPWTNL